jgi:hypothetical protein
VVSRPTPFRVALEQLTDALVQAVLEAVRGATVVEILETSTTAAEEPRPAPGLRPRRTGLPAPAAGRAPRDRRRRQAPTITRTVAASTEAPTSPDSEPSMATEIDAVAMLAALERQTTGIDERPSGAPSVTTAPVVVPTFVSAAPSARPPALRPGEEVLRTATGGVVLRRRRAESRG